MLAASRSRATTGRRCCAAIIRLHRPSDLALLLPQLCQRPRQRVVHQALQELIIDVANQIFQPRPFFGFGGIAKTVQRLFSRLPVDIVLVGKPLPTGIGKRGFLDAWQLFAVAPAFLDQFRKAAV